MGSMLPRAATSICGASSLSGCSGGCARLRRWRHAEGARSSGSSDRQGSGRPRRSQRSPLTPPSATVVRSALITSDTYRIAAVEQLAAYADILELPLEVAQGKEELAKRLRSMKTCDLVLVDTAGRNPKDDQAVAQMADDLSPELIPTRMLCVAAGTNPRTLAEVLRVQAGGSQRVDDNEDG